MWQTGLQVETRPSWQDRLWRTLWSSRGDCGLHLWDRQVSRLLSKAFTAPVFAKLTAGEWSIFCGSLSSLSGSASPDYPHSPQQKKVCQCLFSAVMRVRAWQTLPLFVWIGYSTWISAYGESISIFICGCIMWLGLYPKGHCQETNRIGRFVH